MGTTGRIRRYVRYLLLILFALASPSLADEAADFAFAKHLLTDGMHDLAAQQFRQFIDNHPTSPRTPEAFLLLAKAFIARKSYAQAAETYEGFTIKYPRHVRLQEIWLEHAKYRALAGQYETASRTFLELAKSHPESDYADDALLGAAASLVKLGEGVRAEGVLTTLITKYAKSRKIPAARVLLGSVRLERGDAKGAEKAINPVVRNPRFNSRVAEALDIGTRAALLRRSVPDARRLTMRLVRQAPGDVRTWGARMALGDYLIREGRKTGEVELLNQAADLYKEAAQRATSASVSETALFNLALVRELQNTPTLALSNWTSFLGKYPHSGHRPRAILGQGRAHLAINEPEKGIFAFEALLTTYPDSVESTEALGLLGDYYMTNGDAVTAVVYYHRQLNATKDERSKRPLTLKIAEIREHKLADYQQARRLYSGLTFGENGIAARSLLGLGRCYRALGDIDRSENSYEQVMLRFSSDSTAAAARDSLTMIRLFLRPDVGGAFVAKFDIESRNLLDSGNVEITRRETRLALAKIRVTHLKDYRGAISLLESYLADGKAQSPHEGEHLLALCYFRLSTRARLERKDSLRKATRTLALDALARLASRYPSSSLADDAFIETTEARLVGMDSLTYARETLTAYKDFFTAYPASDRKDFVLVRTGEAILGLAKTSSEGSPDEALRRFNESLTVAPNGPVLDRALFGSAVIMARQGLEDGAVERLRGLIIQRPLSDLVPESRFALADILIDQKKTRVAARELEKLLRAKHLSRDVNEIRRRLVACYESVGDDESVITVGRQMVASGNPKSAAWGARHLASAYIRQSRTSEAENVLTDELKTRPRFDGADSLTILLARLQAGHRGLDVVTRLLTGFETRYPTSRFVPDAWRLLADVQFDQGSIPEALANYRRTLNSRPDDKQARMGEVVSLYRLGRASEAQRGERVLRDRIIPTADDEVRLAIEKGHALARARDFVNAIGAFAKVVDEYPRSAWADDALMAQGRISKGSGRLEPAVAAFEKLIRIYTDSPLRQEAAFELGNTYYQSKFYEQAADAYTRALEQDTTSKYAPTAMWNLVVTYEKIRRYDSAIRTMRIFLRRFPKHENVPRLYRKIGLDLYHLGEFPDAIVACEEALRHVTGSEEAEVRYYLGESHFMMEKYRLALVEWLKLAYHSGLGAHWPSTAMFRAAKAYEKLGQVEEAKRLYRKIIASSGPTTHMGRFASLQLLALEGGIKTGSTAVPVSPKAEMKPKDR
jgi:TolA-binding protein